MLDTLLRLTLVALSLACLGAYARRREPLLRDAGVMLGALAALAAFRMVDHGTTWHDLLLRDFGAVVLLAQPPLLLRLVAYFQRVPRAIAAVSLAGVAIAAGADVGFGLSMPTTLGLGIVLWFLGLQAYCVSAFIHAAWRRRGAARRSWESRWLWR